MHKSAEARAGRREWIGLAVLTLPTLVVSMDITVLHLAMPHLSADLAPSGSQLLWIVDIYGFLIAGALIPMGTLGDRIGRRKLLMIGGAVFGVASVVAAFSTSAEMLIISRAFLGIAGATLMPSTLSLIRNMFHDQQQRTIAISVWTVCFSVGSVIGPLVGGALLAHFWWGSALLVGAPVMVVLLVLGPMFLPEYRAESTGRMDFTSAALSMVAVLSVIYGIKQVAEHGLGWGAAAFVVAGAAVGVIFARRQRKLADPLLDLTLFGNRSFSTALSSTTAAIFIMMGGQIFIVQYMQSVMGISPLVTGLWLLVPAAGEIIGASLTPGIARRVQPAFVVGGGLLVSATGFVILAQVNDPGDLLLMIVGMGVMYTGLAPVIAMSTELVVGTAPPERAGAASAISETSGELGGALGIAVLGSVGLAVYRGQVENDLPAGVPSAAADTARETVGGATQASGQVPEGIRNEFVMVTQEAFANGMQVVCWASVAIAAMAAASSMIMLRQKANSVSQTG